MKDEHLTFSTGPVDPFSSPALCPTDAAGLKTNGARFGCSRGGGSQWHGGIDLKANVGTNLKAIYSGEVQAIRDRQVTDPDYQNGVGNFIIIKSQTKGISMKYCHLHRIDVKVGDTVQTGAVIGQTGKSGNAYSPSVPFKHLHLEVSTDYFASSKHYVDPEPYLRTSYGANPNDPDPSHCPAFLDENLDFVRVDPV